MNINELKNVRLIQIFPNFERCKPPLAAAPEEKSCAEKKARIKRRRKDGIDLKDDCDDDDDLEADTKIREQKEQKRKRRTPPKKVQKLHNLTGDLLFQVNLLNLYNNQNLNLYEN